MKPSSQFAMTVIAGCAFMWLGLLSKPLGFSRWGFVPIAVGALVVVLGSYRLKKSSAHGPDTHHTMAPDDANRGRIRLFWVLTSTLVVGSVLSIPLLPYAVDNYTPQLLYAVISAQIVVVVLAIFFLRRRLFAPRSSSNRDRVSS